MEQRLTEVIRAFDLGGEIIDLDSNYGEGHINSTNLVRVRLDSGEETAFIFQRINKEAFHEPDELMENVIGVTKYLADRIAEEGGDPSRETLHFIHAKDGKPYCVDSSCDYWRAYRFIDDVDTYQQAASAEDFARSGEAFARFNARLADYPVDTLHETITNFHNSPQRYINFTRAVTLDPEDRADNVQAEINFLRAREDECGILVNLMENGDLPQRVTHNDTKLNNVLFDKKSGKGITVIDLDTVMPGLTAYDYGDAIRFGASTAVEDETDLSKVSFSLEYYEAYTKAYLDVLGDSLTRREILTLPWGAKLMTYECGMRFLTDYLSGDVYFGIKRPDHNLDRARTQFKLVKEMEEKWDEMYAVIFRHLDGQQETDAEA